MHEYYVHIKHNDDIYAHDIVQIILGKYTEQSTEV